MSRRRGFSARNLAEFFGGLLAFIGLGALRHRRSQPTESTHVPGVADESIRRGYEARDVDISGIAAAALALIGVSVVAVIILGGAFFLLRSNWLEQRQSAVPLSVTPIVPPEPRVQPNPAADYAALKQKQTEQLQGYGWINQQQGTVRIPIDQAMSIIAQRGLPTPVPGAEETVTAEPEATQEPAMTETAGPTP